MQLNSSLALAKNAGGTAYKNLPAAAITAAKRGILDAPGCVLAASTLDLPVDRWWA